MDTGFNVAVLILAVALAVSVTIVAFLGYLVLVLVRRIGTGSFGRRNKPRRATSSRKTAEQGEPVLVFQPVAGSANLSLCNVGNGRAYKVHVHSGWQVERNGNKPAANGEQFIKVMHPGEKVVLVHADTPGAQGEKLQVEYVGSNGRQYLAIWEDSWTRHTCTSEQTGAEKPQTTDYLEGTPTTHEGVQPLWWLWATLATVLGWVLAVWWRQFAQRETPDPGLARERLLLAYNPLLMEVNALPLQAKNPDINLLVSQYNTQVRPLLYAQSHLLSPAVLCLAADVDGYIASTHVDKLVGGMRDLQERVRVDHLRLQNATLRTHNRTHTHNTGVGA